MIQRRRSSVIEIAERVINGRGSIDEHVASFWELHSANASLALKQLLQCTKHAIAYTERSLGVKRFTSFVAAIVHNRDDARPDECETFVSLLLHELVLLTTAADKFARYKVCELLGQIFRHWNDEHEIGVDSVEEVQQTLLHRLRDRVPVVREQALLAVARLQPAEGGEAVLHDPVTSVLLNMLKADRNKAVRAGIVDNLLCDVETLTALLERTLDQAEEVRCAVYTMVRERLDSPLLLSVEQRVLLVDRGLHDCSNRVQCATLAMILHWLQLHCNNDTVQLLGLLDVSNNHGTCSTLLAALAVADGMDLVQAAQQVVQHGRGLRDMAAQKVPLTAEQAVFWRAVADQLAGYAHLHSNAAAAALGEQAHVEAAAAGAQLEALEGLLPESTSDLVDLIHVQLAEGDATPAGSYALRQLVQLVARHAELADSAARDLAIQAGRAIICALPKYVTTQNMQAWADALAAICIAVTTGAASSSDTLHDSVAIELDLLLTTADDPLTEHVYAIGLCLHAAWLATGATLRLSATEPLPCTQWLARAVEMQNDNVRAMALHCLGLQCLSQPPSLQQGVVLQRLMEALHDDNPWPAHAAAKALCDIAAVRGLTVVGTLQALQCHDPSKGPLAPVECGTGYKLQQHLLTRLYAALHAAMDRGCTISETSAQLQVASTIAEGLAKVLLHSSIRGVPWAAERGQAVGMLCHLLALQFDGQAEGAWQLRKCLACFIDRFARYSAANKQLLLDSMLPAVRRVAFSNKAPKTAPTQLLNYMLTALQVQGDAGDSRAGPPVADLATSYAVLLLHDIAKWGADGTAKNYVIALCKALPVRDDWNKAQVPRLLGLAGHALRYTADKDSREHILHLQQSLHASQHCLPELSVDEVKDVDATLEHVIAEVEAAAVSTCSVVCKTTPAHVPPTTARKRAPGRSAGRRQASKAAALAASDEETDEDAVQESAAPKQATAASVQRRQPARQTRANRNPAPLPTSSSSSDTPDQSAAPSSSDQGVSDSDQENALKEMQRLSVLQCTSPPLSICLTAGTDAHISSDATVREALQSVTLSN